MTDAVIRRTRPPKRIRKSQLSGLIYVDFEKRKIDDEPPVLLGVLLDDSADLSGAWMFTQYVFDHSLWPLADTTGPPAVRADLRETLDALVRRSDTEARPLVGWSFHDKKVILRWSDHTRFRYRNAIKTAKKWRRGRTRIDDGREVKFQGNDLQGYLRLIGYDVPAEVREGAGTWIGNVRDRLASAGGVVADMAPSGHRDWARLLEHNRHDCLGMQAVICRVHGVEPPGVQDGSS